MRPVVAVSLAIAIIACLAWTVSAGGYGHGGGHMAAYRVHRPPQYAYRYLRQRYLINPGSGGGGYFGGLGSGIGGGGYFGGAGRGIGGGGYFGGAGRGLYGYPAGRGIGGLGNFAVGTGFNLIWFLLLIFAVLFVIGLGK